MPDNVSDDDQFVIFKIISANLTKNDNEGLDCTNFYCSVELIRPDTKKSEVYCRTNAEWEAGENPVWNFTCPGYEFISKNNQIGEEDLNDSVIFHIYADDESNSYLIASTKKNCVIDLLIPNASSGYGQIFNLALFNCDGSDFGSVQVQAILSDTQDATQTKVKKGMFHCPVKRLGVSGGTAPFFSLVLTDDHRRNGKSPKYYIGKDLSRALDEFGFYEQVITMKKSQCTYFDPLLEFMFEYEGVLTSQEEIDGISKGEDLKLLVMRNLFDGKKRLRLLDLKIGTATAAKNWQGKSSFRAYKQRVVDSSTNSTTEGYRLEGFDGMPEALNSFNPLLDMGDRLMENEVAKKKAKRAQLQSMIGQKIFAHFLDLHTESYAARENQYMRVEYLEIILHELITQLTKLFTACKNFPVPQMWIGSSVALGFDCGILPSRSDGDEIIRKSVIVNIFDWGRSEFNTSEKYENMSDKDSHRRRKYWNFYKEGIAKLAWNAALTYKNRFVISKWSKVNIKIMDFDAGSSDDLIGEVNIPIEETPLTTVLLIYGKKKLSVSKTIQFINRKKSTITYSMSWCPAIDGSRICGCWKIKIVKANDLLNKDGLTGISDPYCCITAISEEESKYPFEQYSTLKPNNLSPVWNEEFELPVAHEDREYFTNALAAGGLDVPKNAISSFMLDALFEPTDHF